MYLKAIHLYISFQLVFAGHVCYCCRVYMSWELFCFPDWKLLHIGFTYNYILLNLKKGSSKIHSLHDRLIPLVSSKPLNTWVKSTIHAVR